MSRGAGCATAVRALSCPAEAQQLAADPFAVSRWCPGDDLAAVLRRHLVALAEQTPLLDGIDERAYIDIDSLLRPLYGRAKQGTSFGHTKIAGKAILRRGLSPLAVTICTRTAAPVVAGVRLRSGRAGSSRGAASMVTEAINTAEAVGAQAENILVRGDSAFCSGKVVAAVVKAGATLSFAIAHNAAVDAAIDSIPDDVYIPVQYPGAVTDPDTGELISDAQVAAGWPSHNAARSCTYLHTGPEPKPGSPSGKPSSPPNSAGNALIGCGRWRAAMVSAGT